jgi:hypothetical protein
MASTSWPARFFGLFGPIDDFDNMVWVVRLCPVLSAITYLLSETVFKSKVAHHITLVMAISFILQLSVYMFRAKNLEMSFDFTNSLFNPIWIPRIAPIGAAACMIFGEFTHHDFLSGIVGGITGGITGGIFIALFTTGYKTTDVTLRNPAHDELQQLHLNG